MENNDGECYDDGRQNLIGYVNSVMIRETRDISSGASTTALNNCGRRTTIIVVGSILAGYVG